VTSQSTVQDKRQQLLKAALRLFVENGFHGTPTSKIAAEAGVSNGTLFHYFKSKDELIVELYVATKMEMSGSVWKFVKETDSIRDRFRSLWTSSIQWALQHPLQFHYIQQVHFSPHLTQIGAEVLAEHSSAHRGFLQEAIATGAIKNRDPELLMALVTSQVFGLCQYLSAHQLSPNHIEEVIQSSFDMLWEMIKS
jgi:AcrR family transcriptional regulator